ncbi:MAG: aminopeptidase [Clostridiales bacterium]
MNKKLLKKYAQLAVKVGANVEKDQGVIIRGAVEQSEFIKEITLEAYKAGAKWVEVEWEYQEIEKLHLQYQSLEQLSTMENWQLEKHKMLLKELPAMIYIISEDPDGLAGVDQEKMQKSFAAKRKLVKEYHDAMENKYQWSIIAAPSKAWAKKVFPHCSSAVAEKQLWDAILKTVHITADNDPIEAWKQHNENFKSKCQILTDYDFEYLHYTSDLGTDFKSWLIPQGQWLGGAETTLNGVIFNPNMPTEEIFTTPMKGKAEGVLVATKPLSYQGQLIENFSVTFKNGKVVDCEAKSGEKMLKEMIATDEGSCYLGELALVPQDSPIANGNILFYETLFDENASCHVALGRGFSMALLDYQDLNWEETVAKGINDSLIHVDFMIGDDTLNIAGYTKDGKKVPIFTRGNWCL